MNLTEAAHLARRLMNEQGLGHVPFEFDRGKIRLGACMFKITKQFGQTTETIHKITLSRILTPNLTEAQVRETILHEIAHAKAGHKAGHGPVWRREARSLGIRGDRCATLAPEQRAEPTWKGVCPSCQIVTSTRHRRPARNRIHLCRPCHVRGIRMPVQWIPA